MRKFALLASACVALLFTSIASAQQGDIMVGGGTLMSPYQNNDSVSFHPTPERGGTYINIGGDYIRFKHRLGFSAETAWRDKRATYPDTGESYRPFFTDFNALYAPHIRKKIDVDLFAGIGIATTRFNLPDVTSCSIPTGGCTFFTSSNHFMEDIGGGVRYYVWHHFPHLFVRPEVHYYHIQKDIEFSSSNVFRVGVSVGYTFGH